MDAVWGEESFDRLPNTLQVYVYNIRRILEPTKAKQDPYRVIVSQEPGYVLRLDPQQVDSARFEAMVASARRLSRAGSVAEALTEYAEAQGCWRGSALADLLDEPFARSEARRLETLRLDALEERVQLQMALGLHAELVGELEAMVMENPFREGLRAQLMECLYRCQRQTDALRVFREGREALV